MYKTLAEIVFIFHLFWVLLLIGGIFLYIKWKKYQIVHIMIISITLISQLVFLGCPLTTLQVSLEAIADKASMKYTGSFTGYLLKEVLDLTPPEITITILVWFFLLANIIIFGTILFKKKRRKKELASAT